MIELQSDTSHGYSSDNEAEDKPSNEVEMKDAQEEETSETDDEEAREVGWGGMQNEEEKKWIAAANCTEGWTAQIRRTQLHRPQEEAHPQQSTRTQGQSDSIRQQLALDWDCRRDQRHADRQEADWERSREGTAFVSLKEEK